MVVIFVAFVGGCIIIGAITYGMCCLMEHFNKKGYHG